MLAFEGLISFWVNYKLETYKCPTRSVKPPRCSTVLLKEIFCGFFFLWFCGWNLPGGENNIPSRSIQVILVKPPKKISVDWALFLQMKSNTMRNLKTTYLQPEVFSFSFTFSSQPGFFRAEFFFKCQKQVKLPFLMVWEGFFFFFRPNIVWQVKLPKREGRLMGFPSWSTGKWVQNHCSAPGLIKVKGLMGP